jgi:uncharacterized membrane protein
MNEYNLKTNIRDITLSGLLIAIVFVATKLINVQLIPGNSGSLVHAGTIALFLASFIFGKKKGAIAGAFGMGLFDLLSPYAAWAPFTFVIRLVMGYLAGEIAYFNNKDGENILYNIIAVIISGAWMVAGYYVAEGLLYGNWITPVQSIPANLFQIAFGCLALPIAYAIKKTRVVLNHAK